MACESLNWQTLIEWLFGYTPDITAMLIFCFYEPVCYGLVEGKSPNKDNKALGRFVGFSENAGHVMTFMILTGKHKIIHRSLVHTAVKGSACQHLSVNKDAPNLAPKLEVILLPLGSTTTSQPKDGNNEEPPPMEPRVEIVDSDDEDSDNEDEEDDNNDAIHVDGEGPIHSK